MSERLNGHDFNRSDSGLNLGRCEALSSRLESTIREIHARIEPSLKESGLIELSGTGDFSLLKPSVRESAQEQRDKLTKFNEHVNSLAVESSIEKRRVIHRRADMSTDGKPYVEQITGRLAQYKEIEIVFDLDNTITDHSLQKKDGVIDPYLLGSAILDPHIGRNRQFFPEAYAAAWQGLVRDYPHIFALGARQAAFREGMPELLGQLSQRPDAHVTILSTNFRPFVSEILNRVPGSESFRSISVTDRHILVTAKGDMLKFIAHNNPNRAVVYVGDGNSDLSTLQAKDAIAGYCALGDSSFEKELRQNNIAHVSYNTGDDLRNVLLPESQKVPLDHTRTIFSSGATNLWC